MNRKLLKLLQPSVQLYFICLILFALLSAVYSLPLAGAELVVILCLGLYNQGNNRRRHREISKYLESVTGTVETATKDTITFTDSSAGTATVDSVSVSADGKVLTITAADSFDAFATGDTFDLSGVKAADKTFGNLALTSPGTITLA